MSPCSTHAELEAFPPIRLPPGHVVELRLGGGGGFILSHGASAFAIAGDIEVGYVTPEGARRDYGVDLAGE